MIFAESQIQNERGSVVDNLESLWQQLILLLYTSGSGRDDNSKHWQLVRFEGRWQHNIVVIAVRLATGSSVANRTTPPYRSNSRYMRHHALRTAEGRVYAHTVTIQLMTYSSAFYSSLTCLVKPS